MSPWGADARYTRLVTEHATSMLRLAVQITGNVHDAQDAVQDALISVAAAWPVVQPLPYLKRAVANRCIDIIRRRHDAPADSVPERHEPDPNLFRLEEARHFFDLLQDLPPRQRETLILRYQFDLSDPTIARMLGISVATVRSQSQHALRKLRTAHLSPSGEDQR